MTPLRMRMIEDMRTAGLASGTQALYLDAVRRLAAHYGRSPDELSEEEVRIWLLGLRERGLAFGTFKTNHGGIQFLYRQTLDRDWPLFGKKKDPAAEAAASAGRSARQPDPGTSGLRSKSRAQDMLFADVRLRFADRRSRAPGNRGDRQRQHGVAHLIYPLIFIS
jgi:integrase-like protein